MHHTNKLGKRRQPEKSGLQIFTSVWYRRKGGNLTTTIANRANFIMHPGV